MRRSKLILSILIFISCVLYCFYTVSADVPVQSSQKIWDSTTGVEKSLNATNVSLTPTCFNVTIADPEGDNMNVTLKTNESGSWTVVNQTSGTGLNNGTYSYTNTSWVDSYSTKYWISFNVSDDTGWCNETYHFTTGDDATPPSITINFAGNLSDSGGPYWRPPGENDTLDEVGEGEWRDGYYTNDSRQHEDWIYINLTVVDSGSAVTHVWLQWLNETIWTNWTYAFVNTGGNYWEYNTSSNIQTCEGYNYSFNIVANSSGGSTTSLWTKRGIVGMYVRRYVQLNCTPQSIEYIPLYFYNDSYVSVDTEKEDRLHHDQGADGTINDTGYLLNAIPTDTVSIRRCLSYVGYWFDENVCPSGTFETIYWHSWWASDTGNLSEDVGNAVEHGVFWYKSRSYATYTDEYDGFNTNASLAFSSITYDNGDVNYNNSYSLCCKYLDVTNLNFTDNNIFEIYIIFWEHMGHISTISNRSITSFIIPDIPGDIWNGTDNITDTDSDGLSDHMELNTTYGTCTNPFLADTDNDGVSDYGEHQSGSDPNNYTDTIPYIANCAPVNSAPSPVAGGSVLNPTLRITVSDADDNIMNQTFRTNVSGTWKDIAWNNNTGNASLSNSTSVFSGYSTKYWWSSNVSDGNGGWDNDTYSFTTIDEGGGGGGGGNGDGDGDGDGDGEDGAGDAELLGGFVGFIAEHAVFIFLFIILITIVVIILYYRKEISNYLS